MTSQRSEDTGLPGGEGIVPSDFDFDRELLSHLGQPEIPSELSDEGFLAGIYERAAVDTAAPVAALLQEHLTPSIAPGDASWFEDEPTQEMRAAIEGMLPSVDAPGWLWARVRQDMQAQRAARRPVVRPMRRAVHFAAAALVLCAALIALRGAFGSGFLESEGTPLNINIVQVHEVDDPSWATLGG